MKNVEVTKSSNFQDNFSISKIVLICSPWQEWLDKDFQDNFSMSKNESISRVELVDKKEDQKVTMRKDLLNNGWYVLNKYLVNLKDIY